MRSLATKTIKVLSFSSTVLLLFSFWWGWWRQWQWQWQWRWYNDGIVVTNIHDVYDIYRCLFLYYYYFSIRSCRSYCWSCCYCCCYCWFRFFVSSLLSNSIFQFHIPNIGMVVHLRRHHPRRRCLLDVANFWLQNMTNYIVHLLYLWYNNNK